MGGLGTFLVALAGPIARRVLISLGIGLVTYTGLSLAIDSILGQAKAQWTSGLGGFGGQIGQLVAMAGGNTALSILAGAVITRVSMVVLKKFEPK